MKTKYLVVVCCGLLTAMQANAGIFDSLTAWEPHLRAGVGTGQLALVDDNEQDTAGWNVVVGYEFNRFAAAELSWVGAGESFARTQAITGGTRTDTVANHFWLVSGVGTYPVTESFSAYGRLGMLKWTGNAISTTGAGTGEIDGFEPCYGLGVALTFNDGMLRLEYDRATVLDEDISYIWFSAVWKIAL